MQRSWVRVGIYSLSALVVVGVVSSVLSTVAFLSSVLTEPSSVRFFFFTAADVGALLSSPPVAAALGGCLVLVGLVAYTVRGDLLEVVYGGARAVAEGAGILGFDDVLVTGAVSHEGVRWLGHYRSDEHVEVARRECPFCALELVETHLPHTRVNEAEGNGTGKVRWEITRDRTADATAELVEALACPQCAFAVEGEKSNRPTDEVRSLLRPHFERIHRDEPRVWRERARERVGDAPGPGDLWDEYVLDSDEDALLPVNAVETGDGVERASTGTYPALERLREDASGVDWLVARASPATGALLARLFRTDYLDRKAALKRERQETRDELIARLRELERTHGDVLTRGLMARQERRLVDDVGTRRREVGSALAYVVDLGADLDREFLSGGERRRLAHLETQLRSVDLHLEAVETYRSYREPLEAEVDAFETLYSTYEEGEVYLPTDDREELLSRARTIREDVAEALGHVDGETLPPRATGWFLDVRDRFTEFPDRLEGYNERFIEQQEEAFASVLTTEHGPLNESQRRAVIRNDRHNLVDASAGTGKTLTLTQRFLYLHQRGVPIDDIVAITFTGDAAEEMKGRIAAALDGVDERDLNISTYHSLAQRIVEDSLLEAPHEVDMERPWEHYLDGFLDGDETLRARHPDALEAFHEQYEKYRQACEGTWREDKSDGWHRRKLAKFVEEAENFDRSTESIRSQLTVANRSQYHFGLAGCVVLAAFRSWCANCDQAIGYLDMLRTASRLGRENPEYFGGMYQHVLFDEFQDVSEPVLEFVEIFLGGESDTRLFAVGDDWQSIYGFRGSTPRFFIEFAEQFESVGYTQLEVNYRCPPAVVDAGAALMARSEAAQNSKAVRAFKQSDHTPTVYAFEGELLSLKTAHTVQLVHELLEEGRAPSDVMFLASQWDTLGRVERALQRAGIPCGTGEGVTFQTVHSSKGTEAPCVIVLEATDNTDEGIPSKTWDDDLLEPARDGPAYYAEERRLFYVAMTRAEEELHVYTDAGNESRYLEDISEHFEWDVVDYVVGTVTEWHPPEDGTNQHWSGIVDLGNGTQQVATWDPECGDAISEGGRYRFSQFGFRENGSGQELLLDGSSTVEPVG